MSQKIAVILVVVLLIIIVGGTIGISVYYYSPQGSNLTGPDNNQPTKEKTPEELAAEAYPDTIRGTITISPEEVKIKLDTGKEYSSLIVKPVSFYDTLGIKTGDRVEATGKILGGSKIIINKINKI